MPTLMRIRRTYLDQHSAKQDKMDAMLCSYDDKTF